MKKILVVIISCVALITNVNAEQVILWSGNSWMVFCEHYGEKESTTDDMCELYTRGVIEGLYFGYGKSKYEILGLNGKENTPFFCISGSQFEKQSVLVFKQFLERAPSLRNLPVAYLIAEAMKEAFPCAKEGKK